ncbi:MULTISPECIES: hypothetical protein [unclassified Streptomyces]|uniref:hypothetical protein n=1 Tax=unclassified Streptomyces TaxID=2593676 RepID=UPI003D74A7FC
MTARFDDGLDDDGLDDDGLHGGGAEGGRSSHGGAGGGGLGGDGGSGGGLPGRGMPDGGFGDLGLPDAALREGSHPGGASAEQLAAGDDPLAVILRPRPEFLGAPPGRYEAIRRAAHRRRLARTAVAAGVGCVVAVLVAVPVLLGRGSDVPVSPAPPLAPPPSFSGGVDTPRPTLSPSVVPTPGTPSASEVPTTAPTPSRQRSGSPTSHGGTPSPATGAPGPGTEPDTSGRP